MLITQNTAPTQDDPYDAGFRPYDGDPRPSLLSTPVIEEMFLPAEDYTPRTAPMDISLADYAALLNSAAGRDLPFAYVSHPYAHDENMRYLEAFVALWEIKNQISLYEIAVWLNACVEAERRMSDAARP